MSAPDRILWVYAQEHELAEHLADTVDVGTWAAASSAERAHYLELARAAIAWGVPRPGPRRALPEIADTWPDRERRLLRQRLGKAHEEALAQERRLGKLLKQLEEAPAA